MNRNFSLRSSFLPWYVWETCCMAQGFLSSHILLVENEIVLNATHRYIWKTSIALNYNEKKNREWIYLQRKLYWNSNNLIDCTLNNKLWKNIIKKQTTTERKIRQHNANNDDFRREKTTTIFFYQVNWSYRRSLLMSRRWTLISK